ncbi:hypothetical protein S7335_1749 [Synechococcus sp. PCC 7335]|uniref:hypothetical protein n=1 Tax=Synechococcus sp. (strain ATCC 29403 / PCC 7335) TaxID=91464 RepID=UPI00017EE3FB|nr:hypothetical protein [Synechococcus sp. PCC 7335]EDX84052.1 hypothetical protein S7335_1749 [Synechococcus sp. PCC 7335]
MGIWKGERLGRTTHWLRWWDESGSLLLWSAEQVLVERQKAEAARQKAEALAMQLKELGVHLDTLT